MGGKQSTPIVAPANLDASLLKDTSQYTSFPREAPVTQSNTLKDTTLRSVVFGFKDVVVAPDSTGQMVIQNQVDKETFDHYVHTLKVMAQLSRIVYCDTGVIYKLLETPAFGTDDNKQVNDDMARINEEYLPMKRQPSALPNSKEGRPMVSYVTPQATDGFKFAKYISSPSDLTVWFLKGSHVSAKLPTVKDSDLIICFKGSSTVKNFKHDLYSQITPADLSTLLPEGLPASSGDIGNVPASFVKPINKSWKLIKDAINEVNPSRLFVTGHSLGGAYATMFAFMLCEIKTVFPNIQSIHLVTFGCPTVVADKARNTFNAHLDSGFLTLDRVVSSGVTSRIVDIIPSIPAGFSHPGFQPLRTELYPEKKTGRAYNIDTIRKVYQKGGVLGIGQEKGKYEIATKTHMPNKIMIGAYTFEGNAFAHSEYFDIVVKNPFRLYGMKNPGFAGNTFVADISDSGISFKYVASDPTEEIAPDAIEKSASFPKPPPPSAGRRTYRHRRKNKKTKRKHM